MIKKTDEELRANVMFQLGWDSRVTATDIGVAVKDGVVTLTGTVSSYAEKVAAKEAAHSVLGVLDVANEIEVWVSGDARHTDNDIALAVRHALNWDVLVPADKIHSTVTHGQVTLEGNVENLRHRLEAERAVSHLQGVRGVTNKIVVVTPTNPGQVQFLIEELLTVRAEREAGRIRVGV
jgi:osmotically-inducible protein OsmY